MGCIAFQSVSYKTTCVSIWLIARAGAVLGRTGDIDSV